MNRRGFTLIELLAVIVVLGLVLVVTIPSVIGNINNNRISGLHTLSKEVAKWYDRKIVEDKLSTDNGLEEVISDPNKKLLEEVIDNDWHCLGINNSYGLSSKNVKLDGDATNIVVDDNTGKIINSNIKDMCSAIKLVDGKAEVLLIAKEGGEFDTNSSIGTYALSSASEGYNK